MGAPPLHLTKEEMKARRREQQNKIRAADPKKFSERARKARAADPKKFSERARKARAADPKKFSERARKARAADPKKFSERARKARAADPEKFNERMRKARAADPKKFTEQWHKIRAADPVKYLWKCAKQRAKRDNREFKITPADIHIPYDNVCPCCLAVMKFDTPNAPSVDRHDNALGYVPGNVHVICTSCNRRKSAGTDDNLFDKLWGTGGDTVPF
jgi:hypothetical protein